MPEKWVHPIVKGHRQEYGLVRGDYTVGKFQINGVWQYKLWKGKDLIGTFQSFREAEMAANVI